MKEHTPAERETIDLIYRIKRRIDNNDLSKGTFPEINKAYLNWLNNEKYKDVGSNLFFLLYEKVNKAHAYFIMELAGYLLDILEVKTHRDKLYKLIDKIDTLYDKVKRDERYITVYFDVVIELIEEFASIIDKADKTKEQYIKCNPESLLCDIIEIMIDTIIFMNNSDTLQSITVNIGKVLPYIDSICETANTESSYRFINALYNFKRQSERYYVNKNITEYLIRLYRNISYKVDKDEKLRILDIIDKYERYLPISGRLDNIQRRCFMYYNDEDFKTALEYAEEKLKIEKEYDVVDMFTLETVGFINKNLGNYDKSLELYEEAFKLISNKEDEDRLVKRLEWLKMYIEVDVEGTLEAWREKYRDN